MPGDLQRLVEFDFLRATEIAALNSMQWVSKGDKEGADDLSIYSLSAGNSLISYDQRYP
jgi:fructose-1,6-bisphosphatase/sedoheptulose 1,7-bisphosphatase-like protein